MATQVTNVKNMRILMRRDTAENWESANPVLLLGEKGYETDEGNGMKVGNGVTRWNDLPYFVGFDTIDGGNPQGHSAQIQEVENPLPSDPFSDSATVVNY